MGLGSLGLCKWAAVAYSPALAKADYAVVRTHYGLADAPVLQGEPAEKCYYVESEVEQPQTVVC